MKSTYNNNNVGIRSTIVGDVRLCFAAASDSTNGNVINNCGCFFFLLRFNILN